MFTVVSKIRKSCEKKKKKNSKKQNGKENRSRILERGLPAVKNPSYCLYSNVKVRETRRRTKLMNEKNRTNKN